MTFNEAKDYFGNQTKLGEVIGRGKSTISSYKENGGIPFDHQCKLEQISEGKLKANREHDPQNIFFILPEN